MMKITKNEIKKELKECDFDLNNMFEKPLMGVYNYHNWDQGYDSWERL